MKNCLSKIRTQTRTTPPKEADVIIEDLSQSLLVAFLTGQPLEVKMVALEKAVGRLSKETC